MRKYINLILIDVRLMRKIKRNNGIESGEGEQLDCEVREGYIEVKKFTCK